MSFISQYLREIVSKQPPVVPPVDIAALMQETGIQFSKNDFNENIYVKLLSLTLHAAQKENPELSPPEQANIAKQDAIKLTLLFGNYDKAIEYLKTQELDLGRIEEDSKSIHSHCLSIAKNYKLWKNLISKFQDKPGFLKIARYANRIEEFVIKNKDALEKQKEAIVIEEFQTQFREQYKKLNSEASSTILNESQIREIDRLYQDYLKQDIGFTAKKPSEQQVAEYKNRIKPQTDADKKKYLELVEIMKAKTKINISESEYIRAQMIASTEQINRKIALAKISILHQTTNLADLENYAKLSWHPNAHKNVPAAKLFYELNLTDKNFDDYLSLTPIDDSSRIPSIDINGSAIGDSTLYLKKLDPKDPRAAVLGHLTGCCQSIGSQGDPCAVHGITSPNGGFYVICRMEKNKPSDNDEILAQCWAWRGQNGGMVFDSIEYGDSFRNKKGGLDVVSKFYALLADQLVTKHQIPFVTVGSKSATPQNIKEVPVTQGESPINYDKYRDSSEQMLLSIKGASLLPIWLPSPHQDTPTFNTDVMATSEDLFLKSLWVDALETLSKDDNNSYLNTYDNAILKKLVGKARDFTKILTSLIDSKKVAFINSCGYPFLKSLIKSEEEFCEILGDFPESEKVAFINSCGYPFLKSLIKNEEEFCEILGAFPESEKVAFINSCGYPFLKSLIEDISSFRKILSELPKLEKIEFIKFCGGYPFLQSLIKSIYHFLIIKDALNESEKVGFILEYCNLPYLKNLLPNSGSFFHLINVFPDSEKEKFIDKFDAKFYKEIFSDIDEIDQIISTVIPENIRLKFIQKIDITFLTALIKDPEKLCSLVQKLPEKDRMNFINQFNFENFKSQETFVSSFLNITLLLPKRERSQFIEKINHAELTHQYLLEAKKDSSTQYLTQFSLIKHEEGKVPEQSPKLSK